MRSAQQIAEAEERRRCARPGSAVQDAPRVGMTAGRPTITSSDGRSSISLRSRRAARRRALRPGLRRDPLATDFRRGSVGAAANREINGGARPLDGAYFRRARLGVEGMFAEDFNYRFMGEFGGSGTEGPTRINDAWINYTGLRAVHDPARRVLAARRTWTTATSQEELLCSSSAPRPSELSRTLGGADGRIGFAVRGNGAALDELAGAHDAHGRTTRRSSTPSARWWAAARCSP